MYPVLRQWKHPSLTIYIFPLQRQNGEDLGLCSGVQKEAPCWHKPQWVMVPWFIPSLYCPSFLICRTQHRRKITSRRWIAAPDSCLPFTSYLVQGYKCFRWFGPSTYLRVMNGAGWLKRSCYVTSVLFCVDKAAFLTIWRPSPSLGVSDPWEGHTNIWLVAGAGSTPTSPKACKVNFPPPGLLSAKDILIIA